MALHPRLSTSVLSEEVQLGSRKKLPSSHGGCKSEPPPPPPPAPRLDPYVDDDSVEWSYESGTQTLTVTHVNAEFNCCPTELFSEGERVGSEIRIHEHEDLTDGGCFCMCDFDLVSTFAGVPPGSYDLLIFQDDVEQIREAIVLE